MPGWCSWCGAREGRCGARVVQLSCAAQAHRGSTLKNIRTGEKSKFRAWLRTKKHGSWRQLPLVVVTERVEHAPAKQREFTDDDGEAAPTTPT